MLEFSRMRNLVELEQIASFKWLICAIARSKQPQQMIIDAWLRCFYAASAMKWKMEASIFLLLVRFNYFYSVSFHWYYRVKGAFSSFVNYFLSNVFTLSLVALFLTLTRIELSHISSQITYCTLTESLNRQDY